MKRTVAYLPSADRRLADIWLESADRQAVTTLLKISCNSIHRTLANLVTLIGG